MVDPTATTPAPVTVGPRLDADGSDARAAALRHALADGLRPNGSPVTARVEAALRQLPRHLFVPGVSLEEAYTDDTVRTKINDEGTTISCASQPTIVAMMLDQLDVQPSHRILEIGAATGYNAGLLASLAGPTGRVTTIDIDEDLVAGARRGLDAAGFDTVTVIHGDGALGYLPDAPYDRIIATVGAWDIPPAWLAQLTPNGRLVVPVRIRTDVSRSIAFERDPHGDGWRSVESGMCGFVPLRGLADDRAHTLDLTADGSVRLAVRHHEIGDPTALATALNGLRSLEWTGVTFEGMESPEWMWLYLACVLEFGWHRMTVQPAVIDAGLVDPQFGWGAMATTRGGTIAYLTKRFTAAPDRQIEVGVYGHGPAASQLAAEVAAAIGYWHTHHHTDTATFSLHSRTPNTGPAHDPFTIDTPHHRMTIAWRSAPARERAP